ncbi:MAG TPA: glycosyltransferase family 4 protein [Blastocatellia bacterium]|jgi:glycosyltransferase involved in cell wall biosynthesis|nr:glycosyltransferase family 4 protein [Blastocatellia bacterium]
MKILQVCSATDMGGGEVHVADLVRALSERGHAVYLAVRPNSPLRAPLNGVITSWHEMPLRNSLDLQSVSAIVDIIRHHGIDIVHAHVGRDYLVAAMACRKAPRARLVLTRHHYLPLKRNPLYRWLLEDVGAIIAVSDGVRDSIIERLGLPPERVTAIPNWIDPARFQLGDRDQARSAFQIRSNLAVACIGQITPAKGQEEFLRAASRVLQTRSDVLFLVVGEENSEGSHFTAELRRLVMALGLGDKVRFTGFVRDMPTLLAAVDVVVVPSWDEGFSLVTIEAMAARKPVVASNIPAIARIIRDGHTGALFPPRDAKALSDKLNWLLSDAPLRERLGASGQRDVYSRFGRDHVIDQIEALYLDVLKEREPALDSGR